MKLIHRMYPEAKIGMPQMNLPAAYFDKPPPLPYASRLVALPHIHGSRSSYQARTAASKNYGISVIFT
jgi:hypothetical protein